ncbi:MAG: glycosyltransferase family 2 protein [Chloroflexi bacterium]|nr:glycosyltransferase family 2 protein [Chloroflexota bacterium]
MNSSVDIVIPVYNEEHSLPRCIETLLPFCEQALSDYSWRLVVADNGSLDHTHQVATKYRLRRPDRVGVIHLGQKGRGRALKRAWSESQADIRAYMDVDLSTDLSHLKPLLDAIREGQDIATGSRLKRGASTTRSFKRESVSRSYNAIIRAVFWNGFSDAQCGFKAISRTASNELLPLVKDNNWFFDTELLILAEKNGYRIADIPVRWVEDPDTRVKVVATAVEDLKGLARLRFRGIPVPQREITTPTPSDQPQR